MTWANVDDLFPEHPKVLAAGGDAAWLYVCGLCFVNRNLTEGRIPKAVVPRLSDRKSPTKLARRLVDVGLWHEDGDAYRIHDWEKYNEGADAVKARKEQARNAARARWSGKPKRSFGNADHHAPPPDEQCDEHADSMPGAHAGAMPSHSSPTEYRSSSSHHGVSPTPAEEEEADFVGEALLAIAKAKLARRTGPPITDQAEWLSTVIAKDRDRYGPQMASALAAGADLADLVLAFDAQPAKPPSPYGELRAVEFDEEFVTDDDGRQVLVVTERRGA